ncbi:MAG: hypothetical protein K8R64_02310 [Methanosarcinaceae archaeon]|nr:hypothetical protein [Methanosarcinaceae archaeon]
MVQVTTVSNDFNDVLSEFSGENVRVVTSKFHYRGRCEVIDSNTINIVLRDVLQKHAEGWLNISDLMFVPGNAIESIYIERGFPFDEGESLVLAVEEGDIVDMSEEGSLEELS